MSLVLLANIISIVHTTLIISLLCGILVSIRYKYFRPLESAILLGTILVWSLYGGCPLTFLENHVRILSGHPIPLSQIGFIPYYVKSWFGIPISTQQLNIITYVTATIFILISFEWLSKYINIHLLHIRKKK